MHWMILGILNDHLRLEHLDGNGSEQNALADSKQGGLLKSRVLEREHQVVCHAVQEDAHTVGIERVVGESLTLHALLELAYVQFIPAPLAIRCLVQWTRLDVSHGDRFFDPGLDQRLK